MPNPILSGLLAAAIVWPGAAPAQSTPAPPAPPAALQALVASPSYQAHIARLFAALPADVFQRCGTMVSTGSTVTVLKPVTFAADGYPTSGAWAQSFPVSGCGNDTTYHFVFTGQADEKIASIVGMPGGTHADLTLQRDAARYVAIAAQAKAPDCAAPHIRDTRFDARIAGSSQAGKSAWHETWTVAACGRVVSVGVAFVPDATGTRITTDPMKVGD